MTISINGPSVGGIQQTKNDTNVNFNRISSGQRINNAADDAAGLAISNRMAAQLGGLNTSIRNASDGVSLIQVESGALSSITQNLQRVRELSLQAANGTLNDSDRRALQQEADQLLEASRNTLETSNFNGVKLLNSDQSQQFQVGPNVADTISVGGSNIAAALDAEGLFSVDLSTQSGAASAVGVLDSSQELINERNAELGAVANRFDSAIEALQETRINTAEAKSRIADADIAKEASELTANQIRNQVQIAVQAQANGNRGLILQLLS